MQAKGLENSGARLFSNPAGDYGSMVNERVGQGRWVWGVRRCVCRICSMITAHRTGQVGVGNIV
eukprot:365691-Chlamydomonas_euryale.AAC.7